MPSCVCPFPAPGALLLPLGAATAVCEMEDALGLNQAAIVNGKAVCVCEGGRAGFEFKAAIGNGRPLCVKQDELGSDLLPDSLVMPHALCPCRSSAMECGQGPAALPWGLLQAADQLPSHEGFLSR